uniref:Uncharacterized protein n=1 Tax=Mustela putorius furo TaxID=9669 RepID=M3YPC8_MUSPF
MQLTMRGCHLPGLGHRVWVDGRAHPKRLILFLLAARRGFLSQDLPLGASKGDAGPGPAAGGAATATLQTAAVGRAPDLQPPPRPTFRAGGPRAPRAPHLPAGARWSPAASARGRALSPRRLDWWLCWRGHRPRAHRTRPADAAAPPFWPGAPLESRLEGGDALYPSSLGPVLMSLPEIPSLRLAVFVCDLPSPADGSFRRRALSPVPD